MSADSHAVSSGMPLTNGLASIESGLAASQLSGSTDSGARLAEASIDTSNGHHSSLLDGHMLGSTSRRLPSTSLSRNGRSATISHGENGQAEGDLWSSILNSVNSSRAVPVKNVVVLGQAGTGKSTILSHLASASPSSQDLSQQREDTSFGDLDEEKGAAYSNMGLGYSYFDVSDEDGEDVIARVGVYQVSSSASAHLSLIPFALSAPDYGVKASEQGKKTLGSHSRSAKSSSEAEGFTGLLHTKGAPSVEALRESLFMITLDWESPWTFLSQLVEWLDVVRETVERAAKTGQSGSREGAILEEMKASLEASIRAYSTSQASLTGIVTADNHEDIGDTSVASAIVPVSNPAATDDTQNGPLPEGCLTHNYGVPLMIVITKADTIGQLERERNFKEETFDFIQQVLRTISMKYGAGLFFTAQSKPATFDVLRSYMLHRLFSPTPNSSTSGGAFAFLHRPLTVERDVLLVPAGWDSFGKIRALRDGFDCAGMANGWEWDARVERIRRRMDLPKGSRQVEEKTEQEVDRRTLPGLVEGDRSEIESTIKLYETIVEDWDASAVQSNSNANRMIEPDEQAFLAQHYNTLQREGDARSKVPRQTTTAQLPNPSGRSVVGPVGSSSLSLPSVERAMQERQLSDEGRSGKPSRKEGSGRERERDREKEREGGWATAVHRSMVSPALQSPSLSSSDKGGGSRPTSPLGSAQGVSTPKQSEVLHSFFQSLLKEKGPGSAAASGRSAGSRAGTSGATSERKNNSA